MTISNWPTAFFLDLDDTIISYDVNTDECWQRVIGRFAKRYGALTQEKVQASIDRIRNWYWSDSERHRLGRMDLPAARLNIVQLALTELEVSDATLAQDMVFEFGRVREELTQVFPRAIETLQWIRDRTKYLALITNGKASEQRHKIDRFKLAHYFNLIMIEGEFGVGKPDERVYEHALRHFNVKAQETLMIGDNLEWDVAAPQRLGMQGIWVDVRSTGLSANSTVRPDGIISTLSGIVDLLAK